MRVSLHNFIVILWRDQIVKSLASLLEPVSALYIIYFQRNKKITIILRIRIIIMPRLTEKVYSSGVDDVLRPISLLCDCVFLQHPVRQLISGTCGFKYEFTRHFNFMWILQKHTYSVFLVNKVSNLDNFVGIFPLLQLFKNTFTIFQIQRSRIDLQSTWPLDNVNFLLLSRTWHNSAISKPFKH